jgi:hypothetical protein
MPFKLLSNYKTEEDEKFKNQLSKKGKKAPFKS